MTDDLPPEADCIAGIPHPRHAAPIIGQDSAVAAFLDAYSSGRLHHGWLICGPRGVGKATLAWQIARFLMTQPATQDDDMFGAAAAKTTLDVDMTSPLQRRVTALSEPNLYLLRRDWDGDKKKFKAQITVDNVRGLKGFFAMSSADNMRRIVIIDAAEDMNQSAANALLKVLEEPPANAVLLLISHQPSKLLPTLRSRCRALRCNALDADQLTQVMARVDAAGDVDPVVLTQLARGSPGAALSLSALDGPALYQDLIELIATMPKLDRAAANSFAEKMAARGGEARLDLMFDLMSLLIARAARCALGHAMPPAARDEMTVLKRIAPDAHAARAWADWIAGHTARIAHGRAVNLDAALLVLDMLLSMNKTAAAITRRAGVT